MVGSIAPKNRDHMEQWPRYLLYYILRFVPSVVAWIVLFGALLNGKHLLGGPGTTYPMWSFGFWLDVQQSETASEFSNYKEALLAIQNFCLLVYVSMLVVSSASFVHRVYSVVEINVFANVAWLGAACICIVSQFVFCVVSTGSISVTDHVNITTSYYALFAWPVLILILDEAVKAHHRSFAYSVNNLAMMEFQTILGMHSPK